MRTWAFRLISKSKCLYVGFYCAISFGIFDPVPSAPKDVTISISDKEGAVRVHWNSPDEQNGKLTNYRICWRPEDNLRNYNWTCKNVKGNVLNENIYNINATLAYHVRILAKNRAGEGEFSEPAKFFGGALRAICVYVPSLAVREAG